MKYRLAKAASKQANKLRGQTAESVFGNIKNMLGFLRLCCAAMEVKNRMAIGLRRLQR